MTPETKSTLHSSVRMEYGTPLSIIAAAKIAMYGIDLDPCADPKRLLPEVTNHYTEEDNGLVRPWEGNIFINPPYGRSVSHWIDKGLAEYSIGTAKQMIFLVAARTDTKWFNQLAYYGPWCAVRGRLRFDGMTTPAPFPSAIFYVGPRHEAFRKAFLTLGPIYLAQRT